MRRYVVVRIFYIIVLRLLSAKVVVVFQHRRARDTNSIRTGKRSQAIPNWDTYLFIRHFCIKYLWI